MGRSKMSEAPEKDAKHNGSTAKKDLRFQYKGKVYNLKKGDKLSHVPKELHENLKTEGVL